MSEELIWWTYSEKMPFNPGSERTGAYGFQALLYEKNLIEADPGLLLTTFRQATVISFKKRKHPNICLFCSPTFCGQNVCASYLRKRAFVFVFGMSVPRKLNRKLPHSERKI